MIVEICVMIYSQLIEKKTKVKIIQMGVHVGAQRHANCSDQGFKFFATHSSSDQQPINFSKFRSSARKVFVVMQKQY